ncbi:protein kinase domain-containing protein [Streptomyces sp. NPDC002405]|uniref:serine/threonine-protein kinase n=1 Tax=Streptomyces sp. NPDC001231 TaxID=3364549 RepID=UPI0036A5D268
MERLGPGDPQRIGAYRLLARLGAGGMGQVFLARSDRGRTVAVKLVRRELAQQEEFRARFRQEVRAARQVGGYWTAPVLDADTEAAVPWVATGYVAGPSLQRVVGHDHGPLPERSVRILAAGLAGALKDIHAAGLIHRDLKPSNVLVTIDGPRVIDFGIARALETVTDGGLTRTGALVGSPGFMAPEQVRGDRVTTACDVFCLGSVLAYAATGALPFGGADSGVHALMYRIAEKEPDLEALPEGIADLVRACLKKDPAARPTMDQIIQRTGAEDTIADGRLRDPWLPSALVAQLGRHAVQLLDAENPEEPRETTTPPDPTKSPTGPTGQAAPGAPGAPGAVAGAPAAGLGSAASGVPGPYGASASPGVPGAAGAPGGVEAVPGPPAAGVPGPYGASASPGVPGAAGAPGGAGAVSGVPAGGAAVGVPGPHGAAASPGTPGVVPGAAGAPGGPGAVSGAPVDGSGAAASGEPGPHGASVSPGTPGAAEGSGGAGAVPGAPAAGVPGPYGASVPPGVPRGTGIPGGAGVVSGASAAGSGGVGGGSQGPDAASGVAGPAGAQPYASPEHAPVSDASVPPPPGQPGGGGHTPLNHLPTMIAGQAPPPGPTPAPVPYGYPQQHPQPAAYGHPQQPGGWGAPPGHHPYGGLGQTPPYGPPPIGSTPPYGPSPLPDREPRRGGRSTAALVAVALVVALGAGGSVYALMRDGGDSDDKGGGSGPTPTVSVPTTHDATGPGGSDPSPTASQPKSPSPAEGLVPTGYLGSWTATIHNAYGANSRRLTITQGNVGDTVLTLVADGPTDSGGTYHCVFEARLAQRPSGGGPLEIGPSVVTTGQQSEGCNPGAATQVTLLPDGTLQRVNTGSGEKLAYTRQ